jgi:two-component sensor histidine kinase
VEVLTVGGRHLDRVFNISGNHSGEVWAADSRLGLFMLRDGVAHPVTFAAPQGHAIYHLLLARDGAMWVGCYRGGISVVREGAATHYDSGDGLGGGTVRAIYEDHTGAIWAGTEDGLSRLHDGRWTTWTTAQGLPEGGVQSIVEDESDGLWLMTSAGLLRLPRSSLNGPVGSLTYMLYGRAEGLRLIKNGAMSNPRLTRSGDGRLWVCTEDGVAVVDPARVRSNPVPPPVVIEQATLDGKTLDITSTGPVQFRGRDLQITYTGISLMVPERVHFRYRMHNLDRDWTDAGTRRNVAYANLPPGPYRFQVIASNNDGVWNTVGASLPLRVTPYFYETTWFALACVVAILLLAWSIHWLKVRRLVSRFQLIAAERTRFTRELHDSLLQGFSGVVYQLEAAARQFDAAPEVSKQRLTRALDQADESLREARQMILSMRIPALENSTLPEALAATARQIVEGMPLQFDVRITGRVRQGHYDLEANIFLLVREAVTNAVNHSSAEHIWVELNYTARQLCVMVKDDGVGLDPETAMAKTGHWGLSGMQERIRQIGGTFKLESAPGRGTRLEISVPWKQ